MKKSRSRSAPKLERLVALDQASNHARNISTLAKLLKTCDVDSIDRQSINCAGFLIVEQTRRLQGELQKLR